MENLVDARLSTTQRLSQYRPFERGGASARDAQDDLVLAALAELDEPCPSIQACSEYLEAGFEIRLDTLEIARALDTLMNGGQVIRGKDGAYALSPGEKTRLEAVATASYAVESEAFHAWQKTVLLRWPNLSDQQLLRLETDLRFYLQAVVRRHGVEAALLQYPEDGRVNSIYAKLEAEGMSFLEPIGPELEDVREFALTDFIRRPTEAQMAYLSRILNVGYFLTVLSIDPECAELVRDITAGQKVYVDTNFVYRLLGIQGPGFVKPAETLLKRTQEAGYECCITPWTIVEFQTSVARSRDYLKRHPIPPSEFAALAADATSTDDFINAYWRKVSSEPGLKPQDFVNLYTELEPHLEPHGIRCRDNGCKAVDQQQHLIDAEVAVLERVQNPLRLRGTDRLEHDARHRVLIERQRGDGHRNFANAGYWFLTHDTMLPRYDFQARGPKSARLPFCVSAGAWLQIVEAFRPKSDDLDRALAVMLTSPYARYRHSLSHEKAQSVAARLAAYKDATPDLAARVFMNTATVQEIAAAGDDEQIVAIDNAIVAAARQVQQEAEAAKDLLAEKERETEELRNVARERELELKNNARAIEERRERDVAATSSAAAESLRREEARSDEALRNESARSQAAIREREAKLIESQQTVIRLRRRIRRAVIAVVAVALFVLGALALGVRSAWEYGAIVLIVVGGAAGVDQLMDR